MHLEILEAFGLHCHNSSGHNWSKAPVTLGLKRASGDWGTALVTFKGFRLGRVWIYVDPGD